MNIFLKYLLKSIFKKKGRSLLLIITITIASALLIASFGAADSASKVTEEQSNKQNGKYNIAVIAKNTTYKPFFDESKIPKDGFKESVPIVNVNGYLNEKINVSVDGVGENNYKKLPNMKILKIAKLDVLSENGAIISERTANSHNFKIGSRIAVKSEDKSEVYRVTAIAKSNGVFSTDEKNQFTIVVNEKKVWNILETNKLYNYMFVRLNSNVDSYKFIKNFNNKDYNCSANLIFDKAKAEDDAKSTQMLFYFMLMIVAFMGAFIIYSCFKLIVLERMPVIGTFLSQGETTFGIVRLLLGESIIYGTIGGILAMFLGKGFLYILADLQNPYKAYGVSTSVELNASWFVTGFVFAIIISVLSSILPVLTVKKLEIKDIILNKISMSSSGYKLSVVGVGLLISSIIINLADDRLAVELSPLVFILFILGSIFALPTFIRIITYPLMKIFENVSVLAKLALNNIRSLKALLNNVRLIIIGMVSILIIMSLSYSYMDTLIGMARDYNEDITITQGNNPHKVNEVISKDKNIKKVIETYAVSDAGIEGYEPKIAVVGINSDTYKDFNNYFGITNKSKFYNDLNKKERNMVIDNKSAKLLKKTVGDTVVLRVNNKKAKYKITDIFDVKASVSQILINKDNMKNDFKVEVPDQYSLQIKGNANKEKATLENKLKGTAAKVTTFNEDVNSAKEDVELLIDVLLFFSLMVVVIGIFAIINNISVSFIQRKRELAMLNSIGVTISQNALTIILEGVFTAVFSIISGGLISYYAVVIAAKLAKFADISIAIKYDFAAFGYVCIGTVITMMLSSIPVVIKNKKLSIVQELKYE
ncbi:ABC transporter permease [Clostridium hydrogenum]|uniref:ABC transporter permease n=1 Tax=Clostridium hydrogenum TaxID=2855764 RepID=UPI002E3779F1|nr:ABC transporter permease [Clostridium hydrogenum]